MDTILTAMLGVMAIAILINLFLKKFQIPTIIGYIFTGVIIINIFSFIQYNHNLAHIAEFGIVFLMFMIGLEFSISRLNSMKSFVFLNGFLQFIITAGIIFLFSNYLLGFPEKTAIIFGSALALSSTAIVLKYLNDNNQINSGYGKKALGILLFQDIAVIPILLMITIFTKDNVDIGTLLLDTLQKAIILFILLFVVGKYFINRFLIWVTDHDSNEIFITAILMIVIGSSYLAHIFGFSFSLGAFIAGMMIAETKFKYQIEADLIPFRDLLLGLFFITVGMQIDLKIVWENIDIILEILFAVIFIKALVIYTILYFVGQKRTALKTSLALFQVGEFALAIFELAKVNNLLSDRVSQILITMVVLSMIITPFILKNVKKIADIIFKDNEDEFIIKSSTIENHIVVCGYGTLGKKVVKRLKERDIPYLILEHDLKLVREGKERNEPIFFGNAAQKSILEAVNIKSSIASIVAVDNPEKLRLICEAIKNINQNINVVVKVKDREEKELLNDINVNHIIVAGDRIADLLIKEALLCKI